MNKLSSNNSFSTIPNDHSDFTSSTWNTQSFSNSSQGMNWLMMNQNLLPPPQEDEWGWDGMDEEEEKEKISHAQEDFSSSSSNNNIPPTISSLPSSILNNNLYNNNNNDISRIISSPSFKELEREINSLLLNETNNSTPNAMQNSSSSNKLNSIEYSIVNSVSNSPANFYINSFPFLYSEKPTRSLVIVHPLTITQHDLYSICSSFGSIQIYLSDFHLSKGFTFLCYFDLKSSNRARNVLKQRFSSSSCIFDVNYSYLFSTPGQNYYINYSQFLFNIYHVSSSSIFSFPSSSSSTINQIEIIKKFFSKYGQISSIFISKQDIENDLLQFTIEYFDVREAIQAFKNSVVVGYNNYLSPSQDVISVFGTSVNFEPSYHNLEEKKRIDQMFSLFYQWKQEDASLTTSIPSSDIIMTHSQSKIAQLSSTSGQPVSSNISISASSSSSTSATSAVTTSSNTSVSSPTSNTINQLSLPFSSSTTSATSTSETPLPADEIKEKIEEDKNNSTLISVSEVSASSSQSTSTSIQDSSIATQEEQVVKVKRTRHNGVIVREIIPESNFKLDLDEISQGREKRTTIMVRNIPNKYTQQLLLDELNLKFVNCYDFFYLPIDFKNKCNVGYAFINFLDNKDIIEFVNQFHGEKWRSFNSDKICKVSFARLQGKEALINRFQSSSLLKKADQYKPLLFYSDGPNKGKPEPFPCLLDLDNEVVNTENNSNENNNNSNNEC